jgi:hypothetical protein
LQGETPWHLPIWLINATVPTVQAVIGNPGPDWHAMGSGDHNSDGRVDIL